jgi:hypothetical protein
MFGAEEFPLVTQDPLPTKEREFCSDYSSGRVLERMTTLEK